MNRSIGPLVTQVWRIDLSVSSDDSSRAGLDDAVLDHEESRRAKAFKFDRDRDRFIRAHVALRRLLSSVTGIEAHKLSLLLDDHGKPTLMPDCGVQFNLSHSEDQALLAVSRTTRIGVDLEKIRPLSDADALAERHFSKRECAHWRTLPVGVARERAFFHCWTRKEAFVKCTGVGLRTDLRRIESGFSGDIVVDGVLIRSLPVVDAFAAAIAIEGKPGTVEILDYRDTPG
jgi:4'-phosphopantetheinyl transferase